MSERKASGNDNRLPLPSPKPGRAQDDRILAYARAHAPRHQARMPGRWVAGMATAGVVALAILIAQPQQPAKQRPMLEEYRGIATPAAAPTTDAPAAKAKTPASGLAPEPSAAGARLISPAADHDLAGNAPEALSERAAEQSADTAQADFSSAALDKEQLSKQLQGYADMLASGQEAKAREAYQTLRENCPTCGLPNTLEQALERYPPAAPP